MTSKSASAVARGRLFLSAAVLCFAGSGWAAGDAWPAKPITWIVGGAAGGPTDAIARAIAQPVSEKLGQAIVIENIGGAGGTIATAKAVKSRPDGYTFVVGHVGYIAAAPSLYRNLQYDPNKDLDAVVRFPDIPAVLVVNANAPFNNLKEMVDYAKQNPGKLNFGDAGVGSMSNLSVAMLAARAGVKVTQVSYKGNAPAMVDVAAGAVDGMIDPVNTAAPQVRGGKVKAIAVTSPVQIGQLPNVPTVASMYPGFDSSVWFALYGPAGLPKEAIEKTHKAFLEVIQDKGTQSRLAGQGALLLPLEEYSPERLKAHTAKEVEKYREAVQTAGIPMQ